MRNALSTVLDIQGELVDLNLHFWRLTSGPETHAQTFSTMDRSTEGQIGCW